MRDHIDGITIDYEPQDGRSPSLTLSLLRTLSAAAKNAGKQFALWANAINSPGAENSGLASRAHGPAIVDTLDEVGLLHQALSPLASSAADNFVAQLALLGGNVPAAKRMLVLDLSMPLSAARQVRNYAAAERVPGVAVWRNGADIALTCDDEPETTRKLRCLAYGQECN